MPEAVEMDVFLTQDNSPTGQSSSPKKPTTGLTDGFGPQNVCSESVEQKHVAAEDVGKGLDEAKIADSESNTVAQLRLPEDLSKNSRCEPFGALPADATANSHLKQIRNLPESFTIKSSSPKKTTSEPTHAFGSECVNRKPLEHKRVISTEDIAKGPSKIPTQESELVGLEPVILSPENANGEQIGPPLGDLTMKSSVPQPELPSEYAAVSSNLPHVLPPADDLSKNPCLEQSGPTLEEENNNSSQSGDKGTSARSRKRKNMLRYFVGSTRVLRSRSQDKSKAPEQSNNGVEDSADREKQRKKRKKKMKKKPANEFLSTRTHLRYLLHRMKYEQNLIDAYSAEGWKGRSVEKLKPEKELQRAKSEIFRCKLKMRDLFQRLDLSCAQGKLPESLFDTEGQIDSEDIFCAKCGSKDLMVDNDIILCDGACERGFHQFCLEPPLLKEDIPPDDEGWLCPGCDCKVNCIDLLNDSQGTNLSITDSWEKVFPEVARGNKQDDNFGIPTDDSEDDDYYPDGPEVNEKLQSEESSSDESDFSFASDDMGNSQNNNQNQLLGLPSDDSDDDDFDPDAPDNSEQVKKESSSSDFTSDSDDFSVAFDDAISPGKDQGLVPSSSNNIKPGTDFNGEISKLGGMKRQSLSHELSYLLESSPAPLSGKRHVERLDYKKLHDETYGNVPSDSSDEDYMDAAVPNSRKNSRKIASISPNGKTPIAKVETNAKDMKYGQKENEETPKRTYRKLDVKGGTVSSQAKLRKGSSEPDSSGCSTTKLPYKRLGETVTQRLFQSFKENQYPKRAAKANLANELGLTFLQVDKWFENARWSYRHSSRMGSMIAETGPNRGTSVPQINENPLEPEPNMLATDAAYRGVESKEQPRASPGDIRTGNLVSEGASDQKSVTPKSRKRKGKLELQASAHLSSFEEAPNQNVQGNSPTVQQVRRSGRTQTRSKKLAD